MSEVYFVDNFSMMANYLRLAVILLGFAVINSVERGFVYCPAYPCRCESMDGELVINCRNLYLSALPTFLSFEGRIKELSLRHNSIQNLPANSFQGLHIEQLNLLDNAVTFIHRDAFSGLEGSLRSLSIQLYAMYGLPTLSLSRLSYLRRLVIVGCKQRSLGADLFSNLTVLEELHLIGCRITKIQAGTFMSLPRLNTLVLAHNALQSQHLTEINHLYDLVYLDLSSNDINHLNNLEFSRFTKLRFLKLGFNKLTHIAKQTFYSLELSLEELVLRDNYINEEALVSLAELRLLQRLDLSRNNITNLSGEYFQGMGNLKCLNLANNKIMVIDKSCFKGLGPSMRELDLQENQLLLIQPGTFSELTKLERLNLSRSKLGRTFELHTFEGLTDSLKQLDVSKCYLVSEDTHALSSLRELTDLDLSGNLITQVDFKIMRHLEKLSRANFSHNNISHFLAGDMSSFSPPLTFVDLSINNIQTIPDCAFFVFRELSDVRLEGNPLSCNCSLSWLFRWLQMPRSRQHHQATYTWTCHAPDSLKDLYFSDLDLTDFKCPNSSLHGERCLALYDTQQTLETWTETRIVQMQAQPPCSPICLNISMPQVGSVFAEWRAEDGRNLSGFNVIFRRHNDSYQVHTEAVSASTANYTFTSDNTADLDICVIAISKDIIPLAQKCHMIPSDFFRDDEGSSKDGLSNLINNSFLPLLFIYISGSFAFAFIVACIVVCIKQKQKTPQRVKPFYLTYPTWYDNRSSVSSSSLTHDLDMLNRSTTLTQSTLLADRLGSNADPNTTHDLSSMASSRRGSRLCNRDYKCECNTVYSLPSQLGKGTFTGLAEVDNEFFFHF